MGEDRKFFFAFSPNDFACLAVVVVRFESETFGKSQKMAKAVVIALTERCLYRARSTRRIEPHAFRDAVDGILKIMLHYFSPVSFRTDSNMFNDFCQLFA